MAEEDKKVIEEKAVSRRDFLKSAGVVVAGSAAGLPMVMDGVPPAAPAQRVELKYTCPIEGHTFPSFTGLKEHFAVAHPQAVVPAVTKLTVNGQEYEVQIEPHWTLQRTLQFKLGLIGTKMMCDHGECGSCTVLIDNKPVLSCTVFAAECEGKSIVTIEGIAADPKWSPLIQAWMKWDASQCGFCAPGQVVSAVALLMKNPKPSVEDVNRELAGNICRCGTYPRHPSAILEAASIIAAGGK